MIDILQSITTLLLIILYIKHMNEDHGKGGNNGNCAVQTV